MKAPILWIALSTICLCSAAQASTTATQIRLNEEDTTTLEKHEVRNIYLGRVRHLDSGTLLKLSCMKKGTLHRNFLREWVGMTPSQFKIHWQKRVFTGKDAMPHFFNTNDEQLTFVEETPGAIGYLSASQSEQTQSGPWYFDPKTARYVQAKRS